MSSEPDVLIRTKDIEELNGHFKMFNYMLKHMDEPLSEEIIKAMHRNLKEGVFEDIANGYAIGEYKKGQYGIRYQDCSSTRSSRTDEGTFRRIS